MQNNILDKILKYKKIEVEEAKINFHEKDLINLIEKNKKPKLEKAKKQEFLDDTVSVHSDFV